MRILVTGGLGHIGSSLIRLLGALDNVDEILLIDNLSTQRYSSLFNLPFKHKILFVELDVRNLELESPIFNEKIDLIIHLAALNDALNSLSNQEQFISHNLAATSQIIKISEFLEVPLIFTSSTSIYAPPSTVQIVNEIDDYIKGFNPYTQSKILEEGLIRKKQNSNYVILRLGTIYGVSTGMRFHTAVNKFCFQAVTGQKLSVWKSAVSQLRPYLSLRDLNLAILHIISDLNFQNQVFNLVSINTTVSNIIEMIESATQKSLDVDLVDSKLMNELSYKVSSNKFENTGFVFNPDLKSDIFDMCQLFEGVKNF
jgi:UDP-glucose 4-epimerase